jgi:3-phenylpropionate/trans-cinnamate dioxygenase ferredoxin reductase subunit
MAGMNVNVWGVTDSIKNLIRSGHPVTAAALADVSTPLDDLAGERPLPPVDLAGHTAATK